MTLLFGFSPGQELMFQIGPEYRERLPDGRGRNPDNQPHAAVDSIGGALIVGFEDLFGGGDRDYDDYVFRFAGGLATAPVPEPSTLLLVGAGLVDLHRLPPCERKPRDRRLHDRPTLAPRVRRSSSSCANVSTIASAAPVPAASRASFEE